MKNRLILISFLFYLFSGCTTLASREAFEVCQAADILTTARALKLSATAYETNPFPVPLLYALKIGLMILVWNNDFYKKPEKETEVPRIMVNLISCAPIPGNLKAAKGE